MDKYYVTENIVNIDENVKKIEDLIAKSGIPEKEQIQILKHIDETVSMFYKEIVSIQLENRESLHIMLKIADKMLNSVDIMASKDAYIQNFVNNAPWYQGAKFK